MRDPYIEYTHRYFRFWLPVYDLFAFTIGSVYRASAERAGITTGETVVDICTGTGEMAHRLARRGARVTGVDVTPDMLAGARSKSPGLGVSLAVMDARRLGFPDRSFDTAMLSLALHDMPRAVAIGTLREAARVAARRVLILDYDLPRRSLLRRLCLFATRWFETVYYPRYVREGLEPLLADAGLSHATRTPIRGSFFSLFEIDLHPPPTFGMARPLLLKAVRPLPEEGQRHDSQSTRSTVHDRDRRDRSRN